MNDFRRSPRRNSRQAIDGVMGAPVRPQLTGRPMNGRALNGDSLRTSRRTIGDFKRPTGYHTGAVPTAKAGVPKDAHPEISTLQMSLPNGKKEDGGRRRRSAIGARGKHKKFTWRKMRKYSLRGGIVALVLLIGVGGFLAVKGYLNLHKVFKGGGSAAALESEVDPNKLKGEGDGRVNILLLGRGGDGFDGANLTDTILLASIDPVNNKTALVSIPRDMWVTTSSGSSKINAVYIYAKQRAQKNGSNEAEAEAAGIKAIEDEVSNILGVSIHYYALVDFKAFREAVDTVGGVDINVTEDTAVSERLWDAALGQKYYLDVQPGLQHFDGQRALFYARSRHTSSRGDFDRAERQRLLIQALSEKVTSMSTYTNPVKVSQLMDSFGSHVSTDFSIDDAMRLMTIGKKIGTNFESIDLASSDNPLVKTGNISGQSVVLPTAGQGDYSQIQALIRTKLVDGYILKEGAKIVVLNGTSVSGLAGEKAEELRSYGYNVTVVADAPTSDYEETVIVDLTKGKNPYTKNYLEKRFSVDSTTKLPDSTIEHEDASFVIILGQE